MAVGDQQVQNLFPLRCVRSELGLAHSGDYGAGWYGSVLLLHLCPLLPEHGEGVVGQPGNLL